MSSYIKQHLGNIFELIQDNNITSFIIPAGYDANVIIPSEFEANETRSYVVIKNESIVAQMKNSNFIRYISSKDMIELLLPYLDKNGDINDICDIIILSELYPGEIHYDALFSLWMNLEKIYDGIPRLVILNSKPSDNLPPNAAKLEIKNPITLKYEYMDTSRDFVYENMVKLISNRIKLGNHNMIIIVPIISEFLRYLEGIDNVVSSDDLIRITDQNKTILITTPDQVAYNYLPNTKYVIDSCCFAVFLEMLSNSYLSPICNIESITYLVFGK